MKKTQLIYPEIKSINGSESTETISDSMLYSINNIYGAFNKQRIEDLKNSWLTSGSATLKTPIEKYKGWHNIELYYFSIFKNLKEIYIELNDFMISRYDTVFILTGKENAYFKNQKSDLKITFRTIRVFTKLYSKSWKQLHQYNSIHDKYMLHKYIEFQKSNANY